MTVDPNDPAIKEDTKTNDEKTPVVQSGTFEDVFAAMGPPSRYQIIQFAMIFTCNIPMVFVNIKYVFISIEPDFTCSKVNNIGLIQSIPGSYIASYNESCTIDLFNNNSGKVKSIDCPQGYDFDGGDDVSFITEWGLVCDKEGIPQLAQTVVAVGGFIGQIFATVISDKYGRWPTITVSLLLTAISEIATAYSPNIAILICLRFLTGLVSAGLYVCVFILPLENVIEKYRLTYTMIAGVMWSLHVSFLCGVATAFRYSGWREFQLYSSIMCLFPFLFIFFVHESPSWLYSVGKKEKAEKIVKIICKTNSVDYEKVKGTFDESFKAIEAKQVCNVDVETDTKTSNALDLFRDRKLLLIVAFTWFASFTNELTNNGLYLTASTLAGDMYLNTALLGMASIPGYIAAWVALWYKGRRFVIILFTVMSGISLLISTFISYSDLSESVTENISLGFFLLGKFAISGGYNTLYMYIPETFPTTLRASGMGMSTTGMLVGGAVAPYLLPFSKIASWAPGVTLASCCLLTSLLFTRLPETRGQKLASDLGQEMSNSEKEKVDNSLNGERKNSAFSKF